MRAFFALTLFMSAPIISAFGASWQPLDPSDLAAATPKVEKDAHAEAILWEIRVADEITSGYPHTVQDHYLKIKIFDQHGVEMFGKVNIPYMKGTDVSDIAARTTKPNGQTVELQKDAIFDRALIRGSGIRVQTRSFALPGLEPGAVLEYRWREYHEDALADYVPIDLQREIPIQKIVVHLKPLVSPYFPYTMRTMWFQAPDRQFTPELGGFYAATWNNMPAFHEEPDMPPERQMRAWMLVYYEERNDVPPEKYWKDRGRKLYAETKASVKVDGQVRSIANELASSGTDEEKLQRLYQYCRTHVRNINGPRSGLTPEERTKYKPNKTPQDTLTQGMGTSRDIDLLFAALATAAGFDARFARTGDRTYGIMGWRAETMYFLPSASIAVNVNNKWRFFDPGVAVLPFGLLRWQEESTFALIADPKDPQMTNTTISTARDSLRKRTAKLVLSDDGTLEGDVRIESTGHLAVRQRSEFEDDSDAQMTERIHQQLEAQFGESEISNVHVENLTDVEKPLIITFHMKLAAYAQRTGKRLFFEPAVFEKNKPPRYSATERKLPVQFEFPWSENDNISVVLPPGYELDHPDLPAPLQLAHIGHYETHATWTASTRTINYTRDFVFGEQGGVMVSAADYPALKRIFDAVHEKDGHMMTAKVAAPATAASR